MESNKFNNLVTFFENQNSKKKTVDQVSKKDKQKDHTGFYDNMIFDIDSLIAKMIVKNICEFEQK